MTQPGRAELAQHVDAMLDVAGVTAAAVAGRTGLSESTIGRYRYNRANPPKPKAIQKIGSALGADSPDAPADLRDHYREALQLSEDLDRGSAHRVVLLRGGSATAQAKWAQLEAETTHVSAFAATMPHGLLQTTDYMRALFEAYGNRDEALARKIRERRERQALLDDPEVRFTVIMPEAALAWCLGSPQIMADQCDHIIDLCQRATGARIGLVPLARPLTRSTPPMTNFDLHDDARVVIGTDYAGTAILDLPRDVAPYRARFESLAPLADFGPAAIPTLRRVADEYRRLSAG